MTDEIRQLILKLIKQKRLTNNATHLNRRMLVYRLIILTGNKRLKPPELRKMKRLYRLRVDRALLHPDERRGGSRIARPGRKNGAPYGNHNQKGSEGR